MVKKRAEKAIKAESHTIIELQKQMFAMQARWFVPRFIEITTSLVFNDHHAAENCQMTQGGMRNESESEG
jgi:hypothetical protein